MVDADLKRRTTEQLKVDILPKIVRYKPVRAGFETNGFQIETCRAVERYLSENKVPYRFKEVEHRGNKVARIQSAEGFIHAVHFPADWQQSCPELMRQLFQFPNGAHDDGPDALESCLQLMGRSSYELKDIFKHNNEQGTGGTFGAQILKAQF